MGRQVGVAALMALALVGLVSARGPPVDGPADACQACLISVRILEDLLCDPAATDFLVDFVEKQICSHMADKAQCHNLAEGLLPTVIQWLRASSSPASLCSSAGVCGADVLQFAPFNKPALRVRDSAECAMCKFVVRTVQQQIDDPQTLEKITEVALQICSDLPAELADGCSDFVNNYAALLSNLIEGMDPEMVCGLIGSCMEALTAVPPPALPAALVQALAGSEIFRRPAPAPVFGALLGLPPPPHSFGPGGKMGAVMGHVGTGVDMGVGVGVQARGQGAEVEGDDERQGRDHDGSKLWWPMAGPPHGFGAPFVNDACDYCRMAVIEAHSLVSNPKVQAEVVNYTKAVCDSFQTFAEACKSYVDMYAPLVFSLLEQYLVPDAVCVQTGLCPPPPAAGMWAAHPSGRSWACWLLDGWLGDALRRVGLGAVLPRHNEPGHGGHMM